MIYIITITLFLGFLIWAILADELENLGQTILAALFGAGVLTMTIMIAYAHLGVDGHIAANQEIYESLVYQYENDLYDNDNDLGKKELMDEIQEWNKDLARYQANQDDFWIGIFLPNVYDQFEFIELE